MAAVRAELGFFILAYCSSMIYCCITDYERFVNNTNFVISEEKFITKSVIQVLLKELTCMDTEYCLLREYTVLVNTQNENGENGCGLEFPITINKMTIEKSSINFALNPFMMMKSPPEILKNALKTLFVAAKLNSTMLAGVWKVNWVCWKQMNRSLQKCGTEFLLRQELLRNPPEKALNISDWVLEPVYALEGIFEQYHIKFRPHFFFPGVQALLDQCCYKEVNLEGTGWGSITVQNHTQLKSLYVSFTFKGNLNVKLETLPELTSLSLPETNMDNFTDDFKHLNKLEVLDVSFNNLTSIPSHLLTSPNLKVLNISRNSLRRLDINTTQFASLQVLNVSRNKIKAEDLPNISELRFLQVLDLSHNAIQSIPEELSAMKNLQVLDLNYNDGLSVFKFLNQKDIFPSLEVLKLSKTGYVITNGNDVLEKVNSFKHIDLSENERFSWAERPFKFLIGKENLTFLNMSGIDMNRTGCLGSALPKEDGALEPLLKLEVLDVSNCNLENLKASTFENFPNLEYLYLSRNKLKTVPSDFTLFLPKIKKIDLSQNILTSIQLQLPVNYTLHFLDLSHNHINVLMKIITSGKVEKLDLSYNYLKSWDQIDIFSPWVEQVNLSSNRIDFPNNNMRNSFQVLKLVDLGGNPVDCRFCKTTELQKWIRQSVSNNVWNFTCAWPLESKGKAVANVKLDLVNCTRENSGNMAIVISVSAISATFLASVALIYRYRLQIAYMLHEFRMKRRYKEKCDIELKEYDAFICYSGLDSAWVCNELSVHLEKEPENYKLCIHDRDFPVGTFIIRNIDKAIKSSRHTIIVLTNKFLNSSWCRWELELTNYTMIHEDRDLIIMIELEPLDQRKIPRFLKYLMNTRTYLEWPSKDSEKHMKDLAWKRLRSALGTSLYQQKKEVEA